MRLLVFLIIEFIYIVVINCMEAVVHVLFSVHSFWRAAQVSKTLRANFKVFALELHDTID